ncbi:MAG TPA: hypothetical protein VMZ52_08790 [Bryobacteraceae bacterium]|nr:hypothetical protein [Bryobacteraceae bacterium]
MRAALILLIPLLLNAEERWLQLQSGPFEVFTNAGEKQGKETLNELEQLRHVLGTTIGQTDLKSVWPIRVVLLKPGKQAASFPEVKLGRDAYLSQVTAIAPETRAGAVRILLQANAGRIPAALERGLITLFSTLQVEGTRVTLGAKPEHPDRDWTRVHMLSVDPAFSGKLRALLFNLQRGVEDNAAYRNAFEKGPAEIETLLNHYLEAGKYGTVAMSGRPLSAQRQLYAKELPASTAALAQADVLFANGDMRAIAAYTALLKQTPELAPANEGLGLMAAQASRMADALRYLESATQGQTAGARAWLELGRLQTELARKRALFTKAAQAAPKWAEPWAALGQLESDPARKVVAWKTAAQLDRRNVSYWRALAEAQDAAQLFADAAKSWGEAERAVETAAEREQIHQARLATDQERVAQSLAQKDAIRRKADQEMQDLKNRALADIRAAETRASRGQAPLNPKTEVIDYKDSLADTKRVAGLLERVDCLGKKARLHIRGSSDSMQLLVSDPTKIVISGGGERALGCGPQTPPRLITVEYTPKPDKKLGTAGEAQFIEFR